MKPHITKQGKNFWCCEGASLSGWGRTPVEAYESWLIRARRWGKA